MHDPVQSDGQMKITSIHKAVSAFRMFSSGHDSFNGIPITIPLTGHPCARIGVVYRVRSMGYQLLDAPLPFANLMWQATSPFHHGHKYLAVERRSKNRRLGRRLRAPPHPHKRRENILLLQTEAAISPLPLPLPLPRRPRPTRPDRALIVSISEPATNSVGHVGQSRPLPFV